MQLLKMLRFWNKSWLASVLMDKGDAIYYVSYWGIKILEHVLKILKRIIVVRVREKVKIDYMQFGFITAKKSHMPFS